jgi:hypothetical protein
MDAVDGEDAEDQVIQRQSHRFGSVHGAALILLGAAVALAPHRSFLPLYAVAAAAWLVLARVSLRLSHTIVIAMVLRALLLFPEPRLSGDVYRYLSDGRALSSGTNPYAYYPSDPRVNHREIRSIYPPHAQFVFALVHELHAWRLLIIAFDITAIVLLRRHGFAYATCPLVLFEGTWSGHLDLIAGVVLLVALLKRSGVALGIASGLKLIPAAAIPALFRVIASVSEGPGRADGATAYATRRTRFLATLGMTLAVPFVPFLGGPIMPGLSEYARRWIFNSPLYELVFFVVEKIPTKTIWTHHPLRFQVISDFVYRHVYADFITRVIMAVIAVGAILLARRVSTAVAALLLCSPAIHPWYWLTLLPSALIERTRWILVALAAPASYLLYDHAPKLLVFALCYSCSALSDRVISRWIAPRGDSSS